MFEAMRVRNRGARFLFVAASLVIVVAGLRAAGPFLLPLFFAIFLSILSWPLFAWLKRHRCPPLLGVGVTVLANIAVVALLLTLVSGSVTSLTRALPRYQDAVERRAGAGLEWLNQHGIDTSDFDWLIAPPESGTGGVLLPGPIDPLGAPEGEAPPAIVGAEAPAPGDTSRPTPRGTWDVTRLVDLFVGTLRGLARFLSKAFVVLLMMIFILLEASALPAKLNRAFRLGDAELARMVKATREIQTYLGMKTLISVATGVLAGTWVWILGVDYPALWGLIAFLLNYIPSLGSIIAAIPPVALTLLDIGPGRAILVAAGFLVINMVLGNFVEPALMGRQFGLSTFIVFLSLVFWYWLWGPVGALLSVPLTMIIKIFLENTEDLRWIATLLGSGKPRNAEAT